MCRPLISSLPHTEAEMPIIGLGRYAYFKPAVLNARVCFSIHDAGGHIIGMADDEWQASGAIQVAGMEVVRVQ